MYVGETLNKLRTEKGLTTKQLAADLTVAERQVLLWESNKVPVNEKEMEKLCNYFDTTPEILTYVTPKEVKTNYLDLVLNFCSIAFFLIPVYGSQADKMLFQSDLAILGKALVCAGIVLLVYDGFLQLQKKATPGKTLAYGSGLFFFNVFMNQYKASALAFALFGLKILVMFDKKRKGKK